MNIIIADDEHLIRSSLRSMLDELDIPVHVVGEAKNGNELIELVDTLSPDLVFVDIRMPNLSGLEAIRMVKDRAPFTQWIMLTGFADFEYAREALRVGAMNYLLKPVTPEALSDNVKAAHTLYEESITGSNRDFEREILSFIHGTQSDDDFDTGQFFPSFKCKAIVYYIDSFLDEADKMRRRGELINRLHQLARSMTVSRHVRFATVSLQNGNLAQFIAWDSRPHADGEHIRRQFEQQLEEVVTVDSGCSFVVTALQTERCTDLTAITVQLAVLDRLSTLRTVVSLGRLVPYATLTDLEKRSELLALGSRLETLCRLFVEKDFVNYSKEYESLKKLMTDKLYNDMESFGAVHHFLRYSIHFTQERLADREAWLAALLLYGERILTARTSEDDQRGDWIGQVMQYVDPALHERHRHRSNRRRFECHAELLELAFP